MLFRVPRQTIDLETFDVDFDEVERSMPASAKNESAFRT